MEFRKKKICEGWWLEQFIRCEHTFILVVPKDTNLFAIKTILSTLPGGRNKVIINSICEGFEIFFSCNLQFKQTISTVAEVLNLPYTPPKRRSIPSKRTAVKQYTLDGEYIRTWEGITEVSQALGISGGNISNCCSGKVGSAGGFKWAKC